MKNLLKILLLVVIVAPAGVDARSKHWYRRAHEPELPSELAEDREKNAEADSVITRHGKAKGLDVWEAMGSVYRGFGRVINRQRYRKVRPEDVGSVPEPTEQGAEMPGTATQHKPEPIVPVEAKRPSQPEKPAERKAERVQEARVAKPAPVKKVEATPAPTEEPMEVVSSAVVDRQALPAPADDELGPGPDVVSESLTAIETAMTSTIVPLEPTEAEIEEKKRYRELKAKATEEPEVKAAREKVEGAPAGEDRKQALRDYYQTLCGKMREMDPSLKERIDRMEAAYLRRVERITRLSAGVGMP